MRATLKHKQLQSKVALVVVVAAVGEADLIIEAVLAARNSRRRLPALQDRVSSHVNARFIILFDLNAAYDLQLQKAALYTLRMIRKKWHLALS